MKKSALVVSVAAALFGVSESAFAINDLEANASIPFSFANPGARSLGMGGAFLGLADDATTAYTNPAGLTQLRQKEVALEVRHTSFSTPYTDGGSLSTSPFSTEGLRFKDANSDTNNVSFLSIVIPMDRWAFSVYRHELSNFDSKFATSEALRFDGAPLFATTSKIDLKIINWGVAAAYAASDRVSIGFGLSRYEFDLSSVTGRYFENRPLRLQDAVQDGNDSGLGWNLGARFQLSDTLYLGASYRYAPRLRYSSSITNLSDGLVPLPTPQLAYSTNDVRFNIPDNLGAGLSWRPSDNLVVNFDVNRVQYSQLTDDISTFFDIASTRRLKLDDGTEVHLGAEYTFSTMQHPLSLRAGVWHDPRHSVYFDGVPDADQYPNNVTFQELFASQYAAGRGPQTHYAFGGGFAFPKFQIDLAADLADGLDTYSLSGVYRF